jgi:hypothetical protein
LYRNNKEFNVENNDNNAIYIAVAASLNVGNKGIKKNFQIHLNFDI